MAYVNLYNPSANAYIRKTIQLGSYTYVLGYLSGSNGGDPYLAKLDGNGTLIWQRRYQFSGTSSGSWIWYRAHFTDLIETDGGELIGLVSDFGSFLLVKLDNQGNIIWKKKYFDRNDTPILYNGLSTVGHMYKIDTKTLIVRIEEIHSENGGIKRINHLFYSIDSQNGAIIATKKIQSDSPLLIIRDEEVRSGELVMFGYYRGAAIIKINAALTITQSVALAYSGSKTGYNYLHIYAASPLYNGNYAVFGSYYYYNPSGTLALAAATEASTADTKDGLEFLIQERDDTIPTVIVESLSDVGTLSIAKAASAAAEETRFSRFFVAEINAANTTVISANRASRDFTATYQTVHRNAQGLAFSIGANLYKLNSSLTTTTWIKTIKVQEINKSLVLSRGPGTTFDSFSLDSASGKFAVASGDADYVTCRTTAVSESVTLEKEAFKIETVPISFVSYSPKTYPDPAFSMLTLAQNADTKLCPAAQPQPNLNLSTIVASPVTILADGSSTSTITVTLRDAQGAVINPSSYTVQINTTAGTWPASVVNNNNGTYTRVLRSSTAIQTASISFSVTGIGTSPNTASVQFTAVPSLSLSTIVANPVTILADGTATSTVTVTLKDAQGNIINPSTNFAVQINTTAGTWTAGVANNNAGVYTRVLKSSTTAQTASLTFSVTGIGTSPNSASVQFILRKPGIPVSDITSLQSPNFLLMTAGSTGVDGSAKGIHLRWFLMGALGAKHLPKGNYAGTTHNFNKTNDFVKIYRAPYQKTLFTLDFQQPPNSIDDNNKLWIYNIGGKLFYIRFLNASQYTSVRASINPLSDPLAFMTNYGNNVIEVDSRNTLFFAAAPSLVNVSASSVLKTETLAVPQNLLTAPKFTNSRKTYSGTAGLSNVQLICENGRSIRYQAASCVVAKVAFEFYADLITGINNNGGWDIIGSYALNQTDTQVFQQLEPSAGLVHNKWQRFNENANVNINNYKDKWNGPVSGVDRNIKMVVSKFIQLSDSANNPSAIESVFLGEAGETPQTEDDMMNISLLDILNAGANDYHVARMLGLGTLDVSTTAASGEFIYVSEYFTNGDLEDGLGARTVQHLSVSLPTSINDQRLPLPVAISQIAPGIVNEPDNGGASALTDPNGYTFDGRYRYVTLLAEPFEEDIAGQAFYVSSAEFNRKDYTFPVYGGVEYRKNSETSYAKPELSFDSSYLNAVPAGQTAHFETVPLMVSEETGVLFIHKQRDSGTHYYNSYGINIFSRAVTNSTEVAITTNLQPANLLKPPINVAAHLVRSEVPLLLTSQQDQDRYSQLVTSGASDKTLVRLSFDYHTHHELSSYKIESIYDGMTNTQIESDLAVYPNDREVYAEEVEIFFRNTVPRNVQGKAVSMSAHPSDATLSVITTTSYALGSTGQTLVPNLASPLHQNYIGGLLVMGEEQYIIQAITPSATNPVITVYNIEISDTLLGNATPSDANVLMQVPTIPPGGLFMVLENMQNTSVWGNYNPHSLKIKVGAASWGVKREVFQMTNSSGIMERFIEKSRGFWNTVNIAAQTEPADPDNDGVITQAHLGMYKITFTGFLLPQHIQYNGSGVSVEWSNGIVRLKTVGSSAQNGERRTFEVVRTENTGTAHVVYFIDPTFTADASYDPVKTGSQLINYYPGYKVYLYADTAETLTAANVLPSQDEGVRYSIFGLRSHDLTYPSYYSRISTPALMFAQELSEPMQPKLPVGALYATRPDFFGKATYTFTTEFLHKPNSVLFYRTNDEALLGALYEKSTIATIRQNLELLGGNDEVWIKERWDNFLNFTFLADKSNYGTYPPTGQGSGNYALPLPDKQQFKDAINGFISWVRDEYNVTAPDLSSITALNQPVLTAAGYNLKVIDFVKETVQNAFVPLTELPVVYQHIKPNSFFPADYNPLPKKQNIKDRNGYVLDPSSPEFDMAPMAKIAGTNPHKVLFTDFSLDGTSKNIYFYGVKELDGQLKMGLFSPFLGPIKMVNTNPPEAPEIKKIIPVLNNPVTATVPGIQFEINAYHKAQHISKATLYRAYNMADAQSVRSMEKVKEIDLENAGILDDAVWIFSDTFEDLPYVPYGDPLYYRVTVSRKIEYNEPGTGVVTEYAPSQPSKITATMIVESGNPDSPVVKYLSEPITGDGRLVDVTLFWERTVFNGKYYVYKMNGKGNWERIAQVVSREQTIYLPLNLTDLVTDTLDTIDADGNTIYHHFKVLAENAAGMVSTTENILTLYIADQWEDIGGISVMSIGQTFIIR